MGKRRQFTSRRWTYYRFKVYLELEKEAQRVFFEKDVFLKQRKNSLEVTLARPIQEFFTAKGAVRLHGISICVRERKIKKNHVRMCMVCSPQRRAFMYSNLRHTISMMASTAPRINKICEPTPSSKRSSRSVVAWIPMCRRWRYMNGSCRNFQ